MHGIMTRGEPRRFALLLCLIAGLSLGGCVGEIYSTYVYPSPDDNVSLVFEVTMGGGAAGYMIFDTFLEGEGKKRTRIGTFYDWYDEPKFWVDNERVNVCMLRGKPDAKVAVPVIGRDGVTRAYQVATVCPASFENIEVEK